jgi:hypothetical protein
VMVPYLNDLFQQRLHGIKISLALQDGSSPDILITVSANGEINFTSWVGIVDVILYLHDKPMFSPVTLQNVFFGSTETAYDGLPGICDSLPSICVGTLSRFPNIEDLHRILRERLGPPQLTDSLWIYSLPPKGLETRVFVKSTGDNIPIKPDEDLARLGARANTHTGTEGPQLGIKCQLMPGFTISQYVSAMYSSVISENSKFGGDTILLTTLLQMNDQIDLVNYVTERLETPKDFILYTLSALNIERYNKNDRHHFCKLVGEGQLEVKDVILGISD